MTNGNYRWVIVAAGGTLGCVAIGCLFSLPVFIIPINESTGWSRTGISGAMTFAFLSMALGSILWGMLTDRFGPRLVVLAGAVLLATSLYVLSLVQSLTAFQFIYGALIGSSMAAFFAPMMATVTGWFDTHRSLAVSLVSAGMGMAPVTMSPFAAFLISTYDWRTSYQIMAVIAAVILIPLAFLLRRPPSLASAQMAASADLPEQRSMTTRTALTSYPFIILALTNFFCCATHSGPIFHTVSYAIACGIPAMAAVTIYSVEGIAGMAGRLGFGVLADKLGAKRLLVSGLLIQAVGALGYFYAHDLATFYTVATVFGFVYAGTMPLYAVLARENFPLRMMGTIIGGTSMAGSLGMATGPLLGGWIFDTTGDYGWLYIACFGMGIGAVLISLMFRPFPAQQEPVLVPSR
ncbi:MFS transporter [Aestuariivirga sp.]|uniref:MFS transporter n=1 Tax=Aestuariivirga sp. TaxID=2650926 RepID=UPI003BA9CB72